MSASGLLDRYKKVVPNLNKSTEEQIQDLYILISDLAIDIEALLESKTDTLKMS